MQRRRSTVTAVLVAAVLVADGLVAGPLVARGSGAVARAAEPPPRWVPRAATFPAVVVDKDVAIPTDDGITLYADVFRPSVDGVRAAPGRFPTVLMITPYNKNGGATDSGIPREYLVRRGYTFVLAETRGTGSSEGVWDFGSDRERRDGYVQVEWAASQPWSTGAVGMIGDSYRGINQWWTAMEQPPHLKAILPIDPPADMYRTGGAAGGELSTLVAAQSLVGVLGVQPGNRALEDPRQALQVAATRPLGVAIAGLGTANIVAGGRQSFDSTYYRRRSGYWNVARIRVPTFVVGGWFDIAQRDAPLMFEELHARGTPVRLLMGPWHHANYGSGLPAASAGLERTLEELALRWFDRWVAERPDPTFDDWRPVTFHRLGADRWETAEAWPPPDVRPAPVHLRGPAAPGAPGALAPVAAAEAGSDALVWHPASGACSRSAQQGLIGLPPDSPCTDDGALNDLTGLAYDLPAAARDRRFAGPIAARLFVSTDRPDAFVAVRVETVSPDGRVEALTDGIDTLSFRALDRGRTLAVGGQVLRPFHPYTQESAEAAVPGAIHEWWIEILPTAAVVPAGHRLRVTVQPSDAAQAVLVGDRLVTVPGGVLRVHHGREHPSAVVVPWQP